MVSVLAGLFVVNIGFHMISPRLKKADWEKVVNPELYAEESVEKAMNFYDKNIKPQIERHRDVYDYFLTLLNIDEETVAQKMDQAGWRTLRPEELIAIRIGAIIVGGAFTLLSPFVFEGITGAMLGLGATAYGYLYPEMKMKQMWNERRKNIRANIADFLDLLIALLEVGTPIQDALLQVAESFQGATGEEFKRAALEAKYNGGQWVLALNQMAKRLQVEEITELVAAMTLASEKGTPLAPVLREQVARVRFRQQRDYEEQASKMGTKLIPIMGVFIFLPMLALLLAPAFIQL